MRELTLDEMEGVSGGIRSVGWTIVGELGFAALGRLWDGFGPASSSTRDFGVVGPGPASATNPSGAGAVNGSDFGG